jgi:hypothetical protein
VRAVVEAFVVAALRFPSIRGRTWSLRCAIVTGASGFPTCIETTRIRKSVPSS